MTQLDALAHFSVWTVSDPDGSEVSLAPSSAFLAKNDQDGHRLSSVVIPAWTEGSQCHTLCPVLALNPYLVATAKATLSHFFVWPTSLAFCSRQCIAQIIC